MRWKGSFPLGAPGADDEGGRAAFKDVLFIRAGFHSVSSRG